MGALVRQSEHEEVFFMSERKRGRTRKKERKNKKVRTVSYPVLAKLTQ